jgi:hypothetical protein
VTYRTGTAALGGLGIADGDPRIICDNCGTARIIGRNGPPPSWFLDGKAVPGWRKVHEKDSPSGMRQDFCARCKVKA